MPTTLITFIGRTHKSNDGYPKTIYEIEGETQAPSAFLGFNLKQHLNPDTLIIMGTNGSMWDHLFDGDLDLGDQAEDARLALAEAVEQSTVSQSQLDQLQPLLAEALGINVQLQIIPFGQALEDQVKLVELMAKHVDADIDVHLDVTHGFRSLPMVALLAAIYLQEIRHVNIKGIWYGAYIQGMDTTPVHNIRGLLRMADWLSSMHSYAKDGDYGVFSDLLGEAGKSLKAAAFFERTSNPKKAKEQLTTWTKSDQYPDDPVASLFEETLKKRISWHRSQTRYQYEMHLAHEYLTHKDYIRAAIFALEAKISEYVYREKIPDEYKERDEANQTLASKSDDYKTLRHIRNSLAHGIRNENQKIDRLVTDEIKLSTELKRLFKILNINAAPPRD